MNNNFFEELNKQDEKLRKEKQNIKDNSNNNGISSLIKILSWLIVMCGFIIGIINYGFNENVGQMLTTWLTYGVCSIGGFALAEIIQILHDIRNRLYKMTK